PMWQFETTFSDIIRVTSDIKTFRFHVQGREKVTYKAGQFFFVTIRIDGKEAVHHFSLSSSPTETARRGYLEFTKRITASEYSQALDRMKPGDWVRLRGAQGEFTLLPTKRDLAFVSGGIGITPLRSMLRYIVDRKLSYDVVLVYGNNRFDNIAFREELDEMAAARKDIRVDYVLSGPDFPPGWTGKRGFVTREVIMESIPDFQKRVFYVSGPLKMVLSLEEQLAAIKVPSKQVKRDYFPGYD
ncbi:MAG: FAD-dependent oxidoreductase, partial [Dehalococcoidia bacterium]|nr:FAD-dependent oxidoreductase [Dehalococcoidia bacterium]